MSVHTLIKFIIKNPLNLMLKINKTTHEFYRAGFISTAINEMIYEVLSRGPACCLEIQKAIGLSNNQNELEAWLDLGAALGELAKKQGKYSLKSSFSKSLLRPENDTWKVFLQTKVEILYNYITQTPKLLKKNEKIAFNQGYG